MIRELPVSQWTIGALAALAVAAAACSTTNSNPPVADMDTGDEPAQVAAPATPRSVTVYFDLDSSLLRDEDRASLELSARQIQSSPNLGRVTIEGHCDERGSEEYNLALGERRADSVRRYLADLGVPPDRLETRSYGEMRPASTGHGEQAWHLNRRAQLTIAD